MRLDLSPVPLGQPAVTATYENTTAVRLVAIVEALDEWGAWRERIATCCTRLAALSEADWFLVADTAAAPAFPVIDDYMSPAKGRMFNELMRQIDKRLNGADPAWFPDWYMKENNPYRFTEYQAVLDELRATIGDDAFGQMFDGEPELRLPRHIYTAGDLAELLTAEAIKAQSFAAFVSHDLVGRLALSLEAVARVFPELETCDRTQREPANLIALPGRVALKAQADELVATFKRPKNKADKWTAHSTEELRRQITALNGLGVAINAACIMVADAWNAGLAADDPERVAHESIATHWRGRAKPLDDAKRAIKDKRQA